MKRYLSFFGSIYYPSGGMEDFEGDFDLPEHALECLLKKAAEVYPDDPWTFQWAHVWDLQQRRIVWSSDEPARPFTT